MDAGGIDKNNLSLVVGEDAPQPVTGGLGNGGSNGHLLADQGIH